jgi:type IV secretory pathway VirJ component
MRRAIIGIVVAIAAGLVGLLGYMGYFGGAVFTPVAATAPAKPAERDIAAVFLSGDMGFNLGLGPSIARRIAAHGIPVIGVNSLTYFRTTRIPEEARALVEQAMDRALAMPGARRVVLIGQSFGADMLQRALYDLPPARRARIAMVGFVVPGVTLDFKATPGGAWSPASTEVSAVPTARTVIWVPVTCIYGREEGESLCPQLTAPNVARVALPGGHMLDYASDRVADALIAAIDRDAGTLPKVQTPPTARP